MRIFPLLALLALLAACSPGPDGEQDYLCRRIVPVLFERGSAAKVVASEAGRAGEVFMRIVLPGSTREHVVYCRFAGSGFSMHKRQLVAAAADGRPLGESAVFFLREGWLETQDSVVAAPAPASYGGDDAAPLGPVVAYMLQQGLAALPKTGILVLLAASYALIYGLTGRINLAFGAFAALGGIATTIGVAAMDMTGASGLAEALLFGLACGLVLPALYGLIAAQAIFVPLAARPGQHLLVASVGLMIALEEFLRLVQGANTRWLAPILNAPLTLARAPAFDVTVTPIAIAVAGTAAVAALALLAFLRFSRFGRFWRAVADDAVAAALMGVPPDAVLAASFALAMALAGLSGALVAIHYGGMGFSGGAMLGFTALVAAILGGIGSVGGAMLGGLAIGALEAAWSAAMPIEYREVALFLLLALVLALKPDGLAGGRLPGPMRV